MKGCAMNMRVIAKKTAILCAAAAMVVACVSFFSQAAYALPATGDAATFSAGAEGLENSADQHNGASVDVLGEGNQEACASGLDDRTPAEGQMPDVGGVHAPEGETAAHPETLPESRSALSDGADREPNDIASEQAGKASAHQFAGAPADKANDTSTPEHDDSLADASAFADPDASDAADIVPLEDNSAPADLAAAPTGADEGTSLANSASPALPSSSAPTSGTQGEPAANDNATLWERLSGSVALDTMRKIVQEGFTSSDAVVIASVDGFQDALSASSLAGMLHAPILLTDSASLSSQTAEELARLKATKAYIVGGTKAVSAAVGNDLSRRGLSVERLSGKTASQTADAIAQRVAKAAPDTFIVATQAAYQDALSISPYAYARVAPIFLADPTSGLSSDSLSIVREGSFLQAVLVGGKLAVPVVVEQQLASSNVPQVKRVSGKTSYDTSAAVAEWCVQNGMQREGMGVATGKDYRDALAGAALCGAGNTVLVLVDDANRSATDTVYRSHIPEVGTGYVFGGKMAVSQVTWDYLHQPVGATTIIPSKRTLADGLFTIALAKDGSFVVDVAGGKLTSGANVDLYKTNGTMAQKWSIVWNGRGYTVRNLASGRALAVLGGSMVAGANVVQVALANDDAQTWAIAKQPTGAVVLRNLKSGMALDLSGAKAISGANIRVWYPTDAASQIYTLTSTEALSDGAVYAICLASNSRTVFDVPGGTAHKDTQLQVYAANGSPAQKYVARRLASGAYAFQSLASGLYLRDASGKLVQDAKSTAAERQWTVQLASGGVMLKNAATGRAMGTAGGKTSNGTKLVTSAAADTAAQRFAIRQVDPIDNGTYTIRSLVGGRVLNVAGSSFANGANINVWSSNGSGGQAFMVQKVGSYYRITNVLSDKVVEVAGASKANGANVQQNTKSSSDAQLWKAVVTDAGAIVFVNKATGKVLDVAGGENVNGANVQQFERNDTNAQQWRLSPSSYRIDTALKRAGTAHAYTQSATNYLICVDLTAHRTIVFTGSAGNWSVTKNYVCSVGAPGTPTPTGDYTVTGKGYSFGNGFTCYYYTQFWGDYLFHSGTYYQGTRTVMDNRMGMDISHGCVRLDIDNAYWIYTNVPYGTRVRIYR